MILLRWLLASTVLVVSHANDGLRGGGDKEGNTDIEHRSLLNEDGGAPLFQGPQTIQQVHNSRYLDAYLPGSQSRVVTRPKQPCDHLTDHTQFWDFTPIGRIYTIQQKSTMRYVDAYTSGNDYQVVTRLQQPNDPTQQWVFYPRGPEEFEVQQLKPRRYLDAHEATDQGWDVVTRTKHNHDSQRWIVTPVLNQANTYTIRQKNTGRYLDAFQSGDYQVVTRLAQNNNTQRWIVKAVGTVYRIQQKFNNRNLDAHSGASGQGNDWTAFTNASTQNDGSQHWVVKHFADDDYTMQQMVNLRFLDAYTNAPNDFDVVTRNAQNNPSQRWTIRNEPWMC